MPIDETLRNKYKIPLSCPLCELIMRGKSSETFFRWGVCVMCTIEFVEDREDRWKSGWRPDPEEMAGYLKSRA
jgi:hypothetical protein